MEEMATLKKKGIWTIMDLPEGKKAVGNKWVFTLKYKSDGSLKRYKAKLVAQGFTQTQGLDYEETFAPVAKLNSIRILLSLAVNLDRKLHQLDIKNAFLNGDLEEEIYMRIPLGFEKDHLKDKVCKLHKSLYGLKQLPRAWFKRFSDTLYKLGYKQGQADHTLFTKIRKDGKRTILIVYVDDIIITGDNHQEIENLKEQLKQAFEVKELGESWYFLGLEVARGKEGIFISERKYTLDLLKETGKLGCTPASTPLEPNWKNKEEEEEHLVDKGMYQRLVGKLIYLSHTRPDITYVVGIVSQFMHSPTKRHLEATYHILKYLKGTPGKGLLFTKSRDRGIIGYTGSDWAGAVKDNRSTSGYCTKLWGNLVTWQSKKQQVVSRSSAESEYRSIAQAICEVIWVERLMKDLAISVTSPKFLYSDSKSAINIVNNPVQHD